MYRDLLILLVLKEFLNDINLCKIISNLVIHKEYQLDINNHKKLSKNYLIKIDLLYPGFFKTALFNNMRYDYYYGQDELESPHADRGFSIYNIKPLLSCGKYIDWRNYSPKGNNYHIHCQRDPDDNTKNNGILLVNRLSKKNNDLINRIHLKLVTYKEGNNKLAVWYDFENDMFLNY
jgi:hypothetical protein